MKVPFPFHKLHLVVLAALTLPLTGCDWFDDDDDPVTTTPAPAPAPSPAPVSVSYQLELTNLSNAQPMSPPAAALHSEGHWWQIGQAASTALEQVAEGGDSMALLDDSALLATQTGSGILMPGDTQTLAITVNDVTDANLSVVTMLVNTNDAFSGLNAHSLANLQAGDSWHTYAYVYDAGTEANTEAMGSIPGPVDSGTGFDAARDDHVNFVAMHPGVVTQDDGLSTSVLHAAHKFDNPVLRIKVTRTE